MQDSIMGPAGPGTAQRTTAYLSRILHCHQRSKGQGLDLVPHTDSHTVTNDLLTFREEPHTQQSAGG